MLSQKRIYPFLKQALVFSLAVFGENTRYCYSLGIVVIILLLFTIQRAIHTINGDNSKCIFFRIMPFFSLRLFILNHAPHSRALAPVCSALVTCLQYQSLENTVRKGEIAHDHDEQFLLSLQCFLPFWKIFCHMYQIRNCELKTLPK